MAFKLRSGNKSSFKNMGSSPNKQVKTKGLGPRTAFGGVKNPELKNGKGKIVYKNGKKYYQASDGSLHTGQVDDYERELAQDKKMFKDGPKKQVTGADLGKDPHWQPHQFNAPNKQIELALLRKRKGLGPREIQGEDDQSYEAAVTRKEMGMTKEYPYYYKINGQRVSKEAYIKYKNKPGGDEPGKQTNDPDVYGRKANNHGRGKKTK